MLRERRISLVLAAVMALAACTSPPHRPPGAAERPALERLSVLVTTGGGGELTPAFSPETHAYTLRVGGQIREVVVEASGTGAITVSGASTRSGVRTPVAVPVGSSRIVITACGRTGPPRVYTVAVAREDLRPILARFERRTFQDGRTGTTMGYRLFVPEGYDPARRYPLILFLHGAGDLGDDNEAQVASGQVTAWADPVEQARHPALVLAPQARRDPDASHGAFGRLGWTSLMSSGPRPTASSTPFLPQPQLETAYRLLEQVTQEYAVDRRRIYLTGLSMGGYGAFAMAIAHPRTFAAVVPICGGGDPERLSSIAHVPVWVFHAEEDPAIPVEASRASVAALRAAGGSPRYTEYPRDAFLWPTAHFSWIPAYGSAELHEWLFAQVRAP